jgi:hypothetical protein
MQLVFGRDTLLNISFEADWQYIKERNNDGLSRTTAKRTPPSKFPTDTNPEMRL